MIYREPVNKFVDVETWLIQGNFPPGLRKRVLKEPPSALKASLLDGMLVVITKRNDERNEKALASLLACLKNHADEAIFSHGCRVLPLTMNYRPPVNEDGLTELEVMERADVLVMTVLDALEPRDYAAVNRLIASRALGQPKVTAVVMGDKTAQLLSNAIEAYEERVMKI